MADIFTRMRTWLQKLRAPQDAGQAPAAVMNSAKTTDVPCTKCSGVDFSEGNLDFDTEIYQECHDFAFIRHCLFCNGFVLEYWVEVFDDGWLYWTRIDQKERDHILQLNADKYHKEVIIEIIRNKREVVCKTPSYRYVVQSGQACILDGPPW